LGLMGSLAASAQTTNAPPPGVPTSGPAAESPLTNAPVAAEPAPTTAVATGTNVVDAVTTNGVPTTTEHPDPAPPTTAEDTPAAQLTPQPSGFFIKKGFKIEVVASAPEVVSPVAMAFDEDSRLFVAEMRDYPADRHQRPHLGQIRVLEDPAGEGVFTSSTIFATNLPWPSAIVCYGGGVFVAAAPDILFLQDTDGDGIADTRRVVFTGFGNTNSLDPDGVPHSFYWGVDNRIYGATGLSGAAVVPPDGGATPLSLDGLDFSMDPRSLTLGPETGAAFSGMARDDFGRRYLTSFTRPLFVEMMEYRFLQRNPFVASASPVDDVAGPALAVFSRRPARGGENGKPAVKVGETTTTWMAKARGSVIYRGDLFPTNYLGNVFIADPEARVIHRAILREVGLQVRAERATDERNTEFLSSTDPDFRPTQIINGPDGALYFGDMVRGRDSGRIYRIAPLGYRPRKLPRLSELNTFGVVSALAHTNGWHRDTAARLLFERRDPDSVRLLASMATGSRQPVARMHAMYALAGMGALTEAQMTLLMGDPDHNVRRHAVRLAEGFIRDGQVPDGIWTRLRSLAGDRFVQVRYQAALSAGSVSRPDKPALLSSAVGSDVANPWMQTAVLNSALEGSGALLTAAAADTRVRGVAGAAFLVRLADMIGVSGFQPEVATALEFLGTSPIEIGPGLGLVAALGDGLLRTRSSLTLVDGAGRLQRFHAAALNVAADTTVAQDIRIDAIRVLGVGPFTMADGGAILLALVGGGDNMMIQSAALQSLERHTDTTLAPALIERWGLIPPALRSQAVTTLLARTDRIPVVIAFLDDGRLPSGDFLPWHVNLLRSLRDLNLRDRAVAIFGPAADNRAAELERFTPVLKQTGLATRGRQVFEARCTACHTVGSAVTFPGPDLAGIKVHGREAILQAIVAPDARIAPGHRTVIVNTVGGDTLVGTVDQQDRGALLLRRPGRNITSWPRDNLLDVQVQSWSLMPETVTRGLSTSHMADLLQFLLAIP
jgi:putative membrane-bound dehydrogenase-like protein